MFEFGICYLFLGYDALLHFVCIVFSVKHGVYVGYSVSGSIIGL